MVINARFHPNFFLSVFSKMAVEMIQKSGRLCVLDVEINGVKNIKKTDLNAKYVFVKTPTLVALVSCLAWTFCAVGKSKDSCMRSSDFIYSFYIHINLHYNCFILAYSVEW